VLNVLAQNIPWFLGGSADLASSNRTLRKFSGAGEFEPGTPEGRNIHFGIREHAMAAIVNGLSLSKLRAFGSTFFIFSDYAQPAIRLSALMELPTILVFTHDAIGDGEANVVERDRGLAISDPEGALEGTEYDNEMDRFDKARLVRSPFSFDPYPTRSRARGRGWHMARLECPRHTLVDRLRTALECHQRGVCPCAKNPTDRSFICTTALSRSSESS
jgi:hypothetical protein